MFKRALSLAAAGLVATLLAHAVSLRADDALWLPEGSDNYNLPGNWSINVVPELSANFQDTAIINNGGTAIVSDSPQMIAGITLTSGTLQINRGGSLATGTSFGATGALLQASGGTLTLGGLTGAGAATLNIAGPATLGGTTNLLGPNANLTAASFNLTGSLNTTVTTGGHSTLTTTGDASIGGTLQLEFEGVVPTAGTTWNIVNAATLSGPGFSQIATSSPLGRGQYLAVQQAAGGNGALLQATVADGLVLTVHRRTGEIRIVNPSGTGPLELDGYLITSSGGALDPSFWNSISDQGVTHFVESNPTSKHVGELSLTGSRQIAANSHVSLGSPFVTSLLENGSADLVFSYHHAGGTRSAAVEYVGPTSGVALLIGADGRTWLQNQSSDDVVIDGYIITSNAGSLDTSGWTSIHSSDATWTEANPSANHIGELNLNGQSMLEAGSAAIDLGHLFEPGSATDLVFEYRVPGMGVQQGIVAYGAAPFTFLDGDYDFDEDVDTDDYLVWKSLYGSTTSLAADGNGDGVVNAADYVVWRNNLGEAPASLTASSTSTVPEPATVGGLLLLALACGRRWRH